MHRPSSPYLTYPGTASSTRPNSPASSIPTTSLPASAIAQAPAIGIQFGKFTDGRSYSVAARLREAGFAGDLHALGDINQEVVFLLKRVGFTHFHIPDPGHAQLPDSILTPFGGHYQAGSDGSRAPWQTAVCA